MKAKAETKEGAAGDGLRFAHKDLDGLHEQIKAPDRRHVQRERRRRESHGEEDLKHLSTSADRAICVYLYFGIRFVEKLLLIGIGKF